MMNGKNTVKLKEIERVTPIPTILLQFELQVVVNSFTVSLKCL